MPLDVRANVPRPDDLYQTLLDVHEGLTDEQSARVNAALILLLANHIGDPEVIAEAAAIARKHAGF